MPDGIYLDHAATSPPLAEVRAAVDAALDRAWANPSSPHRAGADAAAVLEDARRRLARVAGCLSEELFFTSGGTESVNLAIQGGARAMRRPRVLVTAIEHPAALEAAKIIERDGITGETIPVDREGFVDEDAFVALLGDDVGLVSLIHGNNIVGTLQRLPRLAGLVRRHAPGALIHADAVQTFGRLPLPLGKVDLVSMTAHKLGGPRGIGALYVRRGVRVAPLMAGGDQERGLRPGTEDPAGAAGFAVAAELAWARWEEEAARLEALRSRLCKRILPGIVGASINGPADPALRLPGILSLRVPGIKGQNLVHFLEAAGIWVSATSACHSSSDRPPHVLVAMGLAQGAGSIRISMGPGTTEAEIEQAGAECVRQANRLLEAAP
ncbi:MAG: cysteine desulfurase family protein [Pseudomonadota bacterium]